MHFGRYRYAEHSSNAYQPRTVRTGHAACVRIRAVVLDKCVTSRRLPCTGRTPSTIKSAAV
jgi:hypothetical protein